jgi:hypothetical protein
MKKINFDWSYLWVFIPVAIVIVGLGIYLLNAGAINRYIATVGQDKTVTKDVVYQANGVRVYHFIHNDHQCYVADDPQGGAGIFCLK